MGGYIGATAVGLTTTAADVQGDITSTDTTPEVILKNTSEEDIEGGREGKITFKGEQSGGEETTLAQIESAHDGTADDEKGDLVFKTNDGNDGASPTERLRLDSSGDMLLSSPDPSFTITNTTHEDTDGGREGTIVFKGEQSGGELSTLAEIEASHDGTADDEKGDLIFKTNDGSDGASPTEAMRIDANQNVGIGTSPSTDWRTSFDLTAAQVGLSGCLFNLDVSTGDRRCMMTSNAILNSSGDFQHILEGHATIYSQQSGTHRWYTAASASAGATASANERMRITSDGRWKFNTTDNDTSGSPTVSNTGFFTLYGAASAACFNAVSQGSTVGYLNRNSSDGTILDFRKDNTTVGNIATSGSALRMFSTATNYKGLSFNFKAIVPTNNSGVDEDNSTDLGTAVVRFDDVRATNGTIQTSDRNEKQDIEDLSEAELRVATAAKSLIKKFRWKDAVEKKGDDARIHVGIIAQDLQAAFEAEGLDAGRYAMFISDTWWEADRVVPAVKANEEESIEAVAEHTVTDTFDTQEEAPEGATERTRLGVRYPELLAFIIGAM